MGLFDNNDERKQTPGRNAAAEAAATWAIANPEMAGAARGPRSVL